MTPAKFEPGDRVRYTLTGGPDHVRTPGYVRARPAGSRGSSARSRTGVTSLRRIRAARKTLYKVGFRQTDWGNGYAGRAQDALYVDL